MKKKFSLLLLSIFVLPLIALFGCGEVLSYPVYVYSSSTIFGSVSGTGTYDEGTTVTLTATAKQGSHFICWVYENTKEIVNDSTFKINNNLDSSQKTEKSTLSFTMNASTQGKYTAIFDDNKMMYVKFNSYRITTNPEIDGEDEDINQDAIMTSTIDLSQGPTSSNLSTVYKAEDVEIKDNLNIYPENITGILKLSATSNQHIRANTQFAYNGKSMTFNFRADIGFQQSTEKIASNNYNYQITYNEGNYKIAFEFKVSADKTFYMILNYTNLTA